MSIITLYRYINSPVQTLTLQGNPVRNTCVKAKGLVMHLGVKVMYIREIHTSPKDKHRSGRKNFVAVDEFIIITMVFCES